MTTIVFKGSPKFGGISGEHARVTAFDIEVVGLRDHARQIRKAWNLCPTTRLNRFDRIDSRR